jgi:hypothetical protein
MAALVTQSDVSGFDTRTPLAGFAVRSMHKGSIPYGLHPMRLMVVLLSKR